MRASSASGGIQPRLSSMSACRLGSRCRQQQRCTQSSTVSSTPCIHTCCHIVVLQKNARKLASILLNQHGSQLLETRYHDKHLCTQHTWWSHVIITAPFVTAAKTATVQVCRNACQLVVLQLQTHKPTCMACAVHECYVLRVLNILCNIGPCPSPLLSKLLQCVLPELLPDG